MQSLIISLRKMCLFSTHISRTAQSSYTDTLVANKDGAIRQNSQSLSLSLLVF